MGKLDKILNKFFDNLKKGRVNSFQRDILKSPKARDAAKRLKQAEEDLGDEIKKQFADYNIESKNN